jgi:hypothetical protein
MAAITAAQNWAMSGMDGGGEGGGGGRGTLPLLLFADFPSSLHGTLRLLGSIAFSTKNYAT